MKNIIVKTYTVLIIIIFTVSILSGCNINEGKTDINKQENTTKDIDLKITTENAKALSIEKPYMIEEGQVVDTQTKIKNVSDFNIRDIKLVYKEYNSSNNPVSTNHSFLELTLEPGEIANISASHKKCIKNVEVVEYSYRVANKLVCIDLRTDNIDVSIIDEKILNSKKYDILAISEPEKINKVNGGYNSKITIKNISDNDIGSVSIVLGELNEENEYIGVSYLDLYEVIKSSQEIELSSVHSINVKNIEVLGYIYDDVVESRTIDINYKLSQATTIKN